MTRASTTETVIALVLGLLLIGFGATLTDGTKTQSDTRASSYVTDPAGARALFDILRELDARPERLRNTVDALPDTDRTLLIVAPSEPLTESDVTALLDWVEDGGRAVVAASTTATRPGVGRTYHRALFEALGLRTVPNTRFARTPTIQPASGYDVQTLLDWSAVSAIVPVPPGVDADARAGASEPVVTTTTSDLAVRVPFGEAGGEFVAFGDESLFTNRHLRDGENAAFVIEVLLQRADDKGRVVFDELHHGYLPSGQREGLATQAARLLVTTWPGRGVLVLVLAWLVLLVGHGLRLGRPLPDPPPRRRELSEHADALGRLLEGARARDEALKMLATGVQRAVAPRAGLAAALPAAEFRRRLAESPADGAEELAEALGRAATQHARKDGELARVARDLARARRRYLHGGG